MSNYKKLKDVDGFEEAIQTKGTVYVKFGAEWCAPCKALDTEFEKLSDKHPLVANTYHIDINLIPAICTDLGVRTVPTTIKFVNGKAVDRRIGGSDVQSLETWMELASKDE